MLRAAGSSRVQVLGCVWNVKTGEGGAWCFELDLFGLYIRAVLLGELLGATVPVMPAGRWVSTHQTKHESLCLLDSDGVGHSRHMCFMTCVLCCCM